MRTMLKLTAATLAVTAAMLAFPLSQQADSQIATQP